MLKTSGVLTSQPVLLWLVICKFDGRWFGDYLATAESVFACFGQIYPDRGCTSTILSDWHCLCGLEQLSSKYMFWDDTDETNLSVDSSIDSRHCKGGSFFHSILKLWVVSNLRMLTPSLFVNSPILLFKLLSDFSCHLLSVNQTIISLVLRGDRKRSIKKNFNSQSLGSWEPFTLVSRRNFPRRLFSDS